MKYFLKCIIGKVLEDGVVVRMEEKLLGRFKELWLIVSVGIFKLGSINNSNLVVVVNFI